MSGSAEDPVVIASHEARLLVSGADAEVRALLASIVPGCKIPNFAIEGTQAECALVLAEGPAPGVSWSEDSNRLAYVAPAKALLEDLIGLSLLALERTHQNHGLVTFHSAAFAAAGKAVLLVGDSNMGKTTLLLEAMRRGHAGIGGEHCLIDGNAVIGGTRNIELYSGHLARYFADVAPDDSGWEARHSIRAPLDHYGITTPGAAIGLVVFPIVAEQEAIEVVALPGVKAVRELLHKSAEVVSGTRMALCGGALAAPSLDTADYRSMRLDLCRRLASNARVLVIKGNQCGVIDAIEQHLTA